LHPLVSIPFPGRPLGRAGGLRTHGRDCPFRRLVRPGRFPPVGCSNSALPANCSIGLRSRLCGSSLRTPQAAPNYILVSGPGLRRPVVLANWKENGVLLLAVANARTADKSLIRGLTHRRRFDLAEFWGRQGQPRPTSPRQANQHGWFYRSTLERHAGAGSLGLGLERAWVP
jgi:hypothetical protein